MPIVNCVISKDLINREGDLVELWADHSGIVSSEMTIDFIERKEQYGKGYAAIAYLSLPSVWPSEEISSLQTGLAAALSEFLSVEIDSVIVLTRVIQSGLVVDSGVEVTW